jgi:hypothetical protein
MPLNCLYFPERIAGWFPAPLFPFPADRPRGFEELTSIPDLSALFLYPTLLNLISFYTFLRLIIFILEHHARLNLSYIRATLLLCAVTTSSTAQI